MKQVSVKSKYRKIILALLQVILVSGFYSTFLYLNNVKEVLFSEYFMVTVQTVLIAIIVFGVFEIIFHNIDEAVFMASITIFLFTNYAFIETILTSLFDFLRYWHILIILIALIIILSITFFKTSITIFKEVNQMMMIIFSGLVIFNIITNIGDIVELVSTKMFISQEQKFSSQENQNDSPNIYYLVFDEYASNTFMDKYLNYDNSNFTKWLEEAGFKVSYSSYSSHYETVVVMTNNVNLDYIIDSNDPQVAERKRINNKLFEIFRQNGYSVQVVGLNSFYGMPDPLNSSELQKNGGKTNDGLSFRELVLKNTPLYIQILSQNLNNHQKEIEDCLAYMKDGDNFPASGTFTLMHIELPHAPFIYDADGNSVPAEHMNDWADEQYYLNQFIYTTKQMQDLITALLNNDPDSIILLTSDHSARALQGIEEEDKKQCFLAYYDKTSEDNIEGESVINVLRKLINNLFDLNMKMIEMP